MKEQIQIEVNISKDEVTTFGYSSSAISPPETVSEVFECETCIPMSELGLPEEITDAEVKIERGVLKITFTAERELRKHGGFYETHRWLRL